MTGGQQTLKRLLRLIRATRLRGVSAARELLQGPIMVRFIAQDPVEDDEAVVVTEILYLLPIAGDIAALLQLQRTQRGGVGCFGFAALQRLEAWDSGAERVQTIRPKVGVMLFRRRQATQSPPPALIGFPFGQLTVEIKTPHLGVPVGLERLNELRLACVGGHRRFGWRLRPRWREWPETAGSSKKRWIVPDSAVC